MFDWTKFRPIISTDNSSSIYKNHCIAWDDKAYLVKRVSDISSMYAQDSLFMAGHFFILAEIDTWMRGDKFNKIHVVTPDVPEECIVLTRLSVSTHTIVEDLYSPIVLPNGVLTFEVVHKILRNVRLCTISW